MALAGGGGATAFCRNIKTDWTEWWPEWRQRQSAPWDCWPYCSRSTAPSTSHQQSEFKVVLLLLMLNNFVIVSHFYFIIRANGATGTAPRKVNFREKEKQILDKILGPAHYDRRIRPSGINGTGILSSSSFFLKMKCVQYVISSLFYFAVVAIIKMERRLSTLISCSEVFRPSAITKWWVFVCRHRLY